MEDETPTRQLLGVSEALMRCQLSGEFSDLTLVCGGGSFQVHKVVVCSQSPVLHAACTGQFKEASSGVYEFKDISEVLLEKLVTFFYSGNYDEDLDASPTKISALQLHARMFALGEQYCIPNLQPLCVKKYEARLHATCEPLEFIESIPDVYNSTAGPVRDLRDVVARYARYRIAEIIQDGEEDAKLAYDDARQKAPEFAMDLLDQYTGTPQCKTCSGAQLGTTKTGRKVCKRCSLWSK